VMTDKDGSGAIDMEELKHCLKELKVEISEKEVEELHAESDMDSSHVIEFKEFIVLLALVYLLGVSSCSGSTSEPGQPTQKSRIGLPQLEATFDTIVEAFVFFDRNKDGYVSKEDLVDAINRSSPGRQGDKIGLERFEEMDWDKNGTVTFKEFLFAFTDWVGLEDEGDDDFVSPS
jgi:calcium-binding protein CML